MLGYRKLRTLPPIHTTLLTPKYSTIKSNTDNTLLPDELSFDIITFNILAPCYHKIVNNVNERIFESESEELFISRNKEICKKLKDSNADIICIQEFWLSSSTLRQLYIDELCDTYDLRELRRTSHWRSRADGLAIFVKEKRIIIQDVKNILFHDCGDRVALLMLLAIKPQEINNEYNKIDYPPQQLIVVNTHLLFPHNEYSSQIRLREMTKILGFIESYKQRDLCESVCGRSDIRLPVIITGDFNGSPKGRVYKYAKQQNFRSAFEEDCSNQMFIRNDGRIRHDHFHDDDNDDGDDFQEDNADDQSSPDVREDFDEFHEAAAQRSDRAKHNNDLGYTLRDPRSINSIPPIYGGERWNKWITHKSHQNNYVAVDHVFYLNPSEQVEEKLPEEIPDWTNLVFKEMKQRMLDKFGTSNMKEAFSKFDSDTSNHITTEEFKEALGSLGFVGEGTAALTAEEINVLIKSADKNGDGTIDFKEFTDRFWLAEIEGKERTKKLGLMLNSKRLSFARSTWLAEELPDMETDKTDGNVIINNNENVSNNSNVTIDTNSNLAVESDVKQSLNPDGDCSSPYLNPQYDNTDNNAYDPGAIMSSIYLNILDDDMNVIDYDDFDQRDRIEDMEFTPTLYYDDYGSKRLQPIIGSVISSTIVESDLLEVSSAAVIETYNRAVSYQSDDTNKKEKALEPPLVYPFIRNNSVPLLMTQEVPKTAASDNMSSFIKQEELFAPMGDIRVSYCKVWPNELESGMWPTDFKISDHGLVTCRFIGKMNPPLIPLNIDEDSCEVGDKDK
eukprot:gene5243-7288_t